MRVKVIFISVLFIILSFSSVYAEVPKMINYQGKITTPQGALIDTTVKIAFAIWSDSTGGDSLWGEVQSSVVVEKGIFSVLLGSVNEIPDSVFDGSVRCLGVKVGDDVEMTPRKAIVSVGYAYRSEYADTVKYALSAATDNDWDTDTSGFNIYRLNGNVGVGTPSPQGTLDINGSLAVAGDQGSSGQVLTSQGPGANPVWSEVTAVPVDNSVSQAKLKTATGEVSTNSGWYGADLTLPGGEYGFYPQIKMNSTQNREWLALLCAATTHDNWHGHSGWTSYKTSITLLGHGGTIYARQRYVTSSGKDHWMFFLINKNTKQAVAGYQAPDHPCYGSGGNENDIPHPFGSYDSEKHEVILIDNAILPELKSKVTSKRSLLTIINEEYEIDFDSKPVYQPREIIEIDEYGDKKGEILQKIKTPEWAKILIGKDEIYLKRRLVTTLPSYISYKKLKPKFDVIAESQILSQNTRIELDTRSQTK